MKKGKFYGIGVGVGDPENITVKATKKLHEVDVIVLPEAKSGEGSTAFNIVKEYVKAGVEQMFLEFPMDEDLKVVSVNRKTDIYKEIENNDNLVLMKISRNFEKIKKAIIETGNKENAVIVSDCGKDNEVIYWDIESVEEVPYFSTMILKKKGVKEWKRFLEIL